MIRNGDEGDGDGGHLVVKFEFFLFLILCRKVMAALHPNWPCRNKPSLSEDVEVIINWWVEGCQKEENRQLVGV